MKFIDYIIILLVVIGTFQFVGWMWKLPSKIMKWYYNTIYKPKNR